MNVRTCAVCGKKFPTKSSVKMYCSKECGSKAAKKKREEDGQLCYLCKKACGGCLWSAYFLPIVGWDATPTIIKDSEGDIASYRIKHCPEFIRG